jgi:oligopeptide transport system substrate-binding protein
MQANPNFHSPVAITRVQYHPVVNEQSAYNRFRNKELHAIGSFPAGELPKVKRQLKDALRMSGLLSMIYLVFNTQSPPFDALPVRQALSLAIDQATLTDKVLRSGNEPAYSFTPHLLSDYDSVDLPHVGTPMDQRLGVARALLAGAGYDASNPLKVTLRHVSGLENKKVNLAITGMWQRIGVQAQLHQSELRTHFSDLRQGDFEVAWAGWIGENNAEHYLSLLQSDIGHVNYGRFTDATFDKLMHTAQQEADLHERNAKLRQAEAHSVHLYPVVPLYTNTVRRLVDPRLKGWFDNPRDVHQVRYLSF